MMHIVPSKRPTAAQILRHPWTVKQSQNFDIRTLQSVPHQHTSFHQVTKQQQHNPPRAATKDITDIKGAVNATFRAINSPQALGIGVGPVTMSELARRRRRGAEKGHN
jgi:ribosomal protein S6 kinase alpha-1/2/3/6